MRTFDKETIRTLQQLMEATLQDALEESFGVKITAAGGKYAAAEATLKFKIVPVAREGEAPVEHQAAIDFRRHCRMFGLEPSDLGRTFEDFDGVKYTITGLYVKRPKYAIQATRQRDGKPFGFPATTVRRALDVSRERAA